MFRFPKVISPKGVIEHLSGYAAAGALVVLAAYGMKVMEGAPLYDFQSWAAMIGIWALLLAGCVLWIWNFVYSLQAVISVMFHRVMLPPSLRGWFPVLVIAFYCVLSLLLTYVLYGLAGMQAGIHYSPID